MGLPFHCLDILQGSMHANAAVQHEDHFEVLKEAVTKVLV